MRGIGLLEVIQKLVSTIINLRMTNAICFCKVVHGFQKQQGCFTAMGDSKLLIKRAACNGKTIYQIFLDLRKAYKFIHWPQVMALLLKYGVGPRIQRYIKTIWDNQTFFLRQSGFYSEAINVDWGVTQGDTNSPIIFNLIVEAVLRFYGDDGGTISSFCANDGLLENSNPPTL